MARRRLELACLLLLLLVSGVASGADELFVTNAGNQSVTVYSRTASGNVAPVRTIVGGNTGLGNPIGIAVDTVHGEIVVANLVGNSITVYALNANGNVAPLRKIFGSNAMLSNPRGLALDLTNDEILVASAGNNKVHAFARTADGDVAPLRTITGGVNTPGGLALDLVHNEIAIVNRNLGIPIYSVIVHSRTASGSATPLRTIQGANTGISEPFGVHVDPVHDEIFVTNGVSPNPVNVAVHSRTADGNVSPLRTISGTNTQLSAPEGVFVDTINDEVVVANAGSQSVRTYPRTANGNVAPTRTLQGVNTLLSATFLTETVTPVVGTSFYTLTPCRVADTRNPNGPYGGPPLAANADRTFVFAGQCGVPAGAKAVAINIATTGPTAGGDLRLFPAGSSLPLVSAINYNAGKTRANNAVIPLGAGGDLTVHVDQPSGTVHAILDVTGYFE
jgi:hypothetical protein